LSTSGGTICFKKIPAYLSHVAIPNQIGSDSFKLFNSIKESFQNELGIFDSNEVFHDIFV